MKNMESLFSIKSLTLSSIIAAIYVVLTLINPFSFGPIQCRVSEAMTILPILFPQSIAGLFVGCLIANIFGSASLLDIIFGSIATLVAAILTYQLRKNKWLAILPPIIINGVVVGLVLHFTVNIPLLETILFVALGEAVAVIILGIPLLRVLDNRNIDSFIGK